VNSAFLALAQQSPANCGGGGLSGMIPILLMIVVFYFLLLRPQQKRQKEHKGMLEALKKGDQVVTRGGLIGRISGFKDDLVILEVQEKVRIRALRSSIENRYHETAGAAKEAASSSPDVSVSTEPKN
jgi:preprotein translocase subunit YajC